MRIIQKYQVGRYADESVRLLMERNILQAIRLPAGPLRLASYFVAINAALAVGFVKGMLGLQQAAWTRSARRNPTVGREA